MKRAPGTPVRGTQRSRGILYRIIAMILILSGCIDPFTPDINETEDIMVINGRITSQEGFQYVEVSRTSPIHSMGGVQPVRFCRVQVEDSKGKLYEFGEIQEGLYRCWMDAADLVPGSEYKLTVTTRGGEAYVSSVEKLLPCPPVEDIPWEVKEMETSNPNISHFGVQFYISTDATGDFAKNFLWELEETWRYLSHYWIMDRYDWIPGADPPRAGIIINKDTEPSDSLLTCYKTLNIPEIYTYSTRNISGDHIRRIPLNFVSDQTDKLYWRYSLLARQYSLSDKAYEFWSNLAGQTQETAELYATQPAMIQGNISSVDHPEETVLGLFFATGISEKRIFIWPNIRTWHPDCARYEFTAEELNEFLSEIRPELYPIYLVRTMDTLVDYAEQHCFDCRLRGGTLERPPFWED